MLAKITDHGKTIFGKPTSYGGANTGKNGGIMRRTKEEKIQLHCEHCNRTGHEVGECFKLHGYTEWFKILREQKGKQVVNLAETSTEQIVLLKTADEIKSSLQGDISAMIQQEFTKFFSGKKGFGNRNAENLMNFAQYNEFAGPAD